LVITPGVVAWLQPLFLQLPERRRAVVESWTIPHSYDYGPGPGTLFRFDVEYELNRVTTDTATLSLASVGGGQFDMGAPPEGLAAELEEYQRQDRAEVSEFEFKLARIRGNAIILREDGLPIFLYMTRRTEAESEVRGRVRTVNTWSVRRICADEEVD